MNTSNPTLDLFLGVDTMEKKFQLGRDCRNCRYYPARKSTKCDKEIYIALGGDEKKRLEMLKYNQCGDCPYFEKASIGKKILNHLHR